MTVQAMKTFIPVALFLAASATTVASAHQMPGAVKAVQLTGLAGVKENTKGILSVENGNLHFVHGNATSDVSTSLIQDVVSGSDSQKSVGKTVGTISMAAPYGSGRVLSLFRSKIDTLTVEYRDADGAFHGAIFTMGVGTAELIMKELIAQGAQTAAAPEQRAGAHSSSSGAPDKEQPAKIKANAIEVDMIQSDGTPVPAEFKVALYENLIRQLEKRGFEHVYREGDRNASSAGDLIVLHSTVRSFKAGSEEAREVTTVAGATAISVHCQFTNAEGQALLERDVTGKVRFFGGNLRATYDFAKKGSRIAYENFSPTNRK